jgi:Zn-dependent protease with chaperone function
VYGEPSFESPKVSTLKRDAAITVTAQQGLWYALQLAAAATGYVRVNDVRINYGGVEDGDANLRALTSGKAGVGRVTETAGVRGIDESDLKSASFNQVQLDAMVANRVDAVAATAHAGEQHWEATTVAYASEAKPHKNGGKKGANSSASGNEATNALKSVLGSLSSGLSSALGTADKVAPKPEAEQAAEELALGPQIAGRILGARPLWNDAGAQQRVNLIGRWVASQTSRPELPWTFGVIDSPEINAFAAPGGYVLVTRGLYEILSTDGEVAAVLGHEISHCVQRDHYNVIRKQELATTGKGLAMNEVQTGTDTTAGLYAREYVEKHGAAVMLTALDREAEYRADEAAEIYVARAGMNPVALYAVLQKMTAAGKQSASLAQLYKTHPALDDRMDHIDRRDYKGLKAYTTRE